ncbi:alpha-1,2-Mannosidase [Schizosaccharomyces pombe]
MVELRETSRRLFYHGYNNYMQFAFPNDELAPLSCEGLGPDYENPNNIGVNDVRGDYLLTLVDVLDTLVVLGDREGFQDAVDKVIHHINFERDTKVQVFEATIRILGGLLSSHIFASEEKYGFQIPLYKGELLTLATELAERLLPAFRTPTGIPFARINLMKGVAYREVTENCAAAASSLVLEFSMLTALTGNNKFKASAENAFFSVWKRRSGIGLLGNSIDVLSGRWIYPVSGVGAGIDSFYEYAFKSYIFLGDPRYLEVWQKSLESLRHYTASLNEYYYQNVYSANGMVMSRWVDSLSAYFPGLLVLAGELELAKKMHLYYFSIYLKFGQLPERYNLYTKSIELNGYPLRPEFAESTYYLYRATKDVFYLHVGELLLSNIENHLWTPCGFAAVENLEKYTLSNRMESFFLSETLKYLFLLFDDDNPIHRSHHDFIFTTEGHLFPVTNQTRLSTSQRIYDGGEVCVAEDYDRSKWPMLYSLIASRDDYDYVSHLVGIDNKAIPSYLIDPSGVCKRPEYSDGFELLYGSALVSPIKSVERVTNNVYISDIIGNKLKFVQKEGSNSLFLYTAGAESINENDTVFLTDPDYETFTRPDALYFDRTIAQLENPNSGQKTFGKFLQFDNDNSLPSKVFKTVLLNNSMCQKPSDTLDKDTAYIAPLGNCSWVQQAKNTNKAGLLILITDGEFINPLENIHSQNSLFNWVKPYIPPTILLKNENNFVSKWANVSVRQSDFDAPSYFQGTPVSNLYLCLKCINS